MSSKFSYTKEKDKLIPSPPTHTIHPGRLCSAEKNVHFGDCLNAVHVSSVCVLEQTYCSSGPPAFQMFPQVLLLANSTHPLHSVLCAAPQNPLTQPPAQLPLMAQPEAIGCKISLPRGNSTGRRLR